MNEKVRLDKEKETLLVPLYYRALESHTQTPIVVDNKAVCVINQVEYDFSRLKIPRKTCVTLCMRAKQFDRYVTEFLSTRPSGTVVQLGCGLDSRFDRVDNGRVEWYDLDFPEVIELRKRFYNESERHHLIPLSVTDLAWADALQSGQAPFLVIAEGLLMYLRESEVKSLFLKLQEAVPGCQIAFDCFNSLTAKSIGRHPSIRITGASVHWGIDDAHEIEKWNEGIRLDSEWFFAQSEDITKLSPIYRALFTLANCGTKGPPDSSLYASLISSACRALGNSPQVPGIAHIITLRVRLYHQRVDSKWKHMADQYTRPDHFLC